MSACALIAYIALVPAYLVVLFDAPPQSALPGTASDRKLDQAEYKKTQDLLKLLAPIVSTTSSPIHIVMRAVGARPKGILIDHVSYSIGKPGTSVVIIEGTSEKREAINTYYDTLKRDAFFKSVVIPVEDLVGTNGSTFILTLTGT